jgi:hypothetical protein
MVAAYGVFPFVDTRLPQLTAQKVYICAEMHSSGFSGAYRTTFQLMRAGASESRSFRGENEQECRLYADVIADSVWRGMLFVQRRAA